MSYKTILVYFNNEKQAPKLIEAATNMATQHGGHVVGLFVTPRVPIYPEVGPGMTAELLKAHETLFKEESEAIHQKFENAMKGQSFSAEWRHVSAGFYQTSGEIIEHARMADILIAPQTDPENPDPNYAGVAEELLIGCGRPVFIVPAYGEHGTFGKNVMVAWNGSRESARAVFDALPVLKRAETVRVLSVESKDFDGSKNVPGAEIATMLSRHGVKCEVAVSAGSSLHPGDELLARLADANCDLLVMGAYGHSRITEFVFSGVSRHMLRHMTVPLLMSH
ncbi:MAG: universal stress protein [Rhodospirillales bacterium]